MAIVTCYEICCQIKQLEEEEEATTKDVSHLLSELRKSTSTSGGKNALNKVHQ